MNQPRFRSIADIWEGYRSRVMPIHASDVQITETRRAVYSACSAMIEMLEDAPDNEADQEAWVISLKQELMDFVELVAKGKA